MLINAYLIEVMLIATTSKQASSAVAFLVLLPVGLHDERDVVEKLSLLPSNCLSLALRDSFSCRSVAFSLVRCCSVSSRLLTYSFFFLRERQADSRFLIMRCWRFRVRS